MLEGALIKYFDADLRISAADISAPMIKLGRGGFTISTKDGVLASEVGELDLCGGEASGSVNVDLSREVAKANLVASLDDVPVEGCLDASFLVPLKGTTSLKAEMSGEGRTYPELIQALSGGLKVNATNGAIPLDLARLLAAAPTPLDGEGWSRNSVTLFDSAQRRLPPRWRPYLVRHVQHANPPRIDRRIRQCRHGASRRSIGACSSPATRSR